MDTYMLEITQEIEDNGGQPVFRTGHDIHQEHPERSLRPRHLADRQG